MKYKYKISVIVACYNSIRFLDDFLLSLKNQTFEDFEIIFVDDGSTDDTLNRLTTFKNTKVETKIIHQSNNGHTVARNAAIKCAEGEYLYICDHDDIFHPSCLELLYKLIKIDDADIAVLSYKRINDRTSYSNVKFKKPLLKKIEKFKGKDNITAQYLSGRKFIYSPWNKLYKMDIIKKMINYPNVFDTNIKFIEDVDFNTKYFSICNKANYADFPIYYWRILKSSISHSKFSLNCLTTLDAHKSFDLLDKNVFVETQIYIKIKKCLDNFTILYLLRKSDFNDKNKIREIYNNFCENLKYCIKGKRLVWYYRLFMSWTKPYVYLITRKKLKREKIKFKNVEEKYINNDIDKYLLTIIVPCYNVEKYIGDFFKSLNKVEFNSVQYIFVNDGSTDNTENLIKEFVKKSNNKHIEFYSQKNEGVCSTKNKALYKVKGKYVIFMDPDDCFMPNALKYIVNALQKENADAFCFKGKLVKENFKYKNQMLKKFQYEIYYRSDLPYLFKSGMAFKDIMIGTPFIIFKNDLIKKVKNYPYVFSEILGEDSNFGINYLLLCKKIVVDKHYYYFYRIRKGSLLHNKFSESSLSIIKSNDRLLCADIDGDVQNYAKSRNCLNSIYIMQKMIKGKYNNKEKIKQIYELYIDYIKLIYKCKMFPFYIRWFVMLTKPYFYIKLRPYIK